MSESERQSFEYPRQVLEAIMKSVNVLPLYFFSGIFLVLALTACSTVEAATPESGEIPVVQDGFAVIADGKLVPVQSVALSFTGGGMVEEVLFEVGDTVEAGAVLARLGNREPLQAAVAAAKLEKINAEQALQGVYDQADLVSAQTQFDLAIARDELEDANYMWRVRQEGHRANGDTIAAAEARLVLAEDALDEAESDYGRVSGLSRDNLARALGRVNLTNARDARDAALRTLNWYTGYPTEVEQAMLDGELAKAEARVEDLERKWELVKNGPDPDLLELAKARLLNAEAALSAAEAALAETELVASMAGEVANIELKAGEQVQPGQIASVVADLANWQVETDNLTEIERPKISVGQQVKISFDALPDLELQGVVEQVSPLFELVRGDVTYAVTIELLESDPRLEWGMTSVVTFLD